METRVESMTVVTVETIETTNAYYELNVTKHNGVVTGVVAHISVQTIGKGDDGIATVSSQSIGSISYSADSAWQINMQSGADVPTYLAEVMDIINSIKERG